MPVLNWDTKAPVDWTGSVFEELMTRGRGEKQMAAALKKTTSIPETQPSVAEESLAPKGTSDKNNTPNRDQGSKSNKVPPKGKTTPNKTKEVVNRLNKKSRSPKTKKPPKGQMMDDDDDFSSPENVVHPGTRAAAAGKRLQMQNDKGLVNNENDESDDEEDRRLTTRNTRPTSNGKEVGNVEDKESSSDEDRIFQRVHSKDKGKDAANNDYQEDDDTDESENASSSRKTYEQSRSPQTSRTKKKPNVQNQGKKKLVANKKSTIKRKQEDFNYSYAKQDRQSHKKKKKRRSPSNDSSTDSDIEANHNNNVVHEDSKATFAADYALLEVFMRQAIHQFSPATKYKKTVMYWSPRVKTAAAHMLIERHKDEIPHLLERYGGQIAMEIRFAGDLRFLANNERAIQTRQIKSTYLSKQNPDTRLAENILENELDLDQTQPPRIHKHNIGHIKSVGALGDLLISPKMYQDQVLFNIFCLGLESGNFRQNRHRPYTPLHELITKAHEAHFRVELYLSLTKKSFRHHNTTSASSERIRLFNVAIAAVREGREKYMKKAVETRMENRTEKQIEESERDNDQDVGSDDNVDIDEDDL